VVLLQQAKSRFASHTQPFFRLLCSSRVPHGFAPSAKPARGHLKPRRLIPGPQSTRPSFPKMGKCARENYLLANPEFCATGIAGVMFVEDKTRDRASGNRGRAAGATRAASAEPPAAQQAHRIHAASAVPGNDAFPFQNLSRHACRDRFRATHSKQRKAHILSRHGNRHRHDHLFPREFPRGDSLPIEHVPNFRFAHSTVSATWHSSQLSENKQKWSRSLDSETQAAIRQKIRVLSKPRRRLGGPRFVIACPSPQLNSSLPDRSL